MIILILAALLTLLTVVVLGGFVETIDPIEIQWRIALSAFCGVVLMIVLWYGLYLLMMRTIQ